MKDAHSEAQNIRKKAEEASRKEMETIVENGKTLTHQMVEQAKKDIELQTNTAKKSLLEEVSNLTIKIVNKFVDTSVSDKEKKATVDQLVSKVSSAESQ